VAVDCWLWIELHASKPKPISAAAATVYERVDRFHAKASQEVDQCSYNPTLSRQVDMGSGHFSASDRYRYLRERAFVYAFILDQLGITE
jgi:protease II